MTAHKDLDTVLDAFFAEGPSEIADDVIEASLRLIDTTDQRRAGFGSRRTRSMSTLTRFSRSRPRPLSPSPSPGR